MDTKIIVSFKLLERKVGGIDVAGLSEFWVDPRGQGVGRKAIRFVEAMTDPKPVVGFAEDDVVGFYQSCDWVIGPMIDGKHMVMSEPLASTEMKGDIW